MPDGWRVDPAAGAEAKPNELWLEDADVGERIAEIASYVDSRPDLFLGSVAHQGERVVYALTNPDVHADVMSSTAGELQRRADKIRVVIRPACRSRADLEDILQRVHDMVEVKAALNDIAASNGRLAYAGFGIDAATGQGLIVLPDGFDANTEARMAEAFGDAIRIEHLRLAGRQNDGSAHYGGAGLDIFGPGGTSVGDNWCTAGFAVDNWSGRWLITAEHCVWEYEEAAPHFHSGPKWFGHSTGAAWWGTGIPDLLNAGGTATQVGDVTMIGDGTDKYSRYIHVDPCCPSKRLVKAKGKPSTNLSVCVSGSNTLARCSVTITGNFWWEPWDPVIGDWNPNLGWIAYRGQRAGVVIGQPGDSGAPVYQKYTSNGAKIIGMLFGIGDNLPGQPGSDVVYLTSRAKVENRLNVTVATGCCNDDSW